MPALSPPRYMSRFRCIAERCEDSCCAGLTVPVSPPQARRIRDALGDTAPISEEDPSLGAVLRMRPDGGCSLLDAERLCSLQRHHGEALLPDICATFPRVVTRWGERWELAGTLACPEVARLCLLAEDAFHLEAAVPPASLLPRPDVARTIEPDEAWTAHAETVRDALLRWLDRRTHPLASRIALLGHFAHAVEDVYFQGTRTPREALQADLDAALQHFDRADTQQAVHQDFAPLALPGAPSVGLFASILRARMAALRGPRFRALAHGVLTSLGLDADDPERLEAAWRLHDARWRHLTGAHGARLDQVFRHYALHAVWRTPFTDAPTLLGYVFRLALRLGLLRFMLMGHPRVEALHLAPATPEASASLDLAVVETFQLVARHVETSPEFLTLARGLEGTGRGAQTLGKTLVFASF
ncbi:flagellin lysine-N-methylase [Melittangium boletus]|uniref:flagellin lysine-N-methylase n=1 Tax=Melittangium boletus TaxID=83453 RepID=UPI003DA5EEE0